MAVPIPIIAGVGVVILLIFFFIIFKILRKRKQSALEGSSSAKGEYQKLESGEQESEAVLEEENESMAKGKKKNRKKSGKSKGKSKRRESRDLESGIEEGTGLNDSSVFTELAIPAISRIQFSISYSSSSKQILLNILRGENFGVKPTVSYEIRVTLLPAKLQKLKTKSQLTGNPVFNELLVFGEVFPQDVEIAALRARVYRLNGRQRNLIGELKADLKADLGLDTNDVNQLWRKLTPVADIADDISDTEFVTNPESILSAPKQSVPMLLISLQYKTVTGKITVEIIKARHMKTLNVQKAPEAFVEVSLLNANGGEIANAKTGVCKGSFHPTFEETFYFPAIEFELTGLTLVFSVFCKKFRKKELIGWFGIGRESTGERERLHWDEMIGACGEPIKGWYVVGQSEAGT